MWQKPCSPLKCVICSKRTDFENETNNSKNYIVVDSVLFFLVQCCELFKLTLFLFCFVSLDRAPNSTNNFRRLIETESMSHFLQSTMYCIFTVRVIFDNVESNNTHTIFVYCTHMNKSSTAFQHIYRTKQLKQCGGIQQQWIEKKEKLPYTRASKAGGQQSFGISKVKCWYRYVCVAAFMLFHDCVGLKHQISAWKRRAKE